MTNKYFYLLSTCLLFFSIQAFSQTVLNGDFNSSGANWSSCGNSTEAWAFETSYGGSNGSNRVAEIDGNGTADTADDMELCQSISGFSVGQTYEITFHASRRTANGAAPSSVSGTVNVNGGALNETFTRTNVDFALTQESFEFTATQNTHTIHITPNFTESLGIIIDNIAIAAVLPVELSEFKANTRGCEIQIDWTVESAQNFSHFELEHSTDGRHFSTIGKIEGENGVTRKEYSFRDEKPSKLNFYRLKEVDIDGSFNYSKTVSAELKDCGEKFSELKVFPTVAGNNSPINISVPTLTNTSDIFLFDGMGRLIHSMEIEANGEITTIQMNIDHLASGAYFIKNKLGETTRFFVSK